SKNKNVKKEEIYLFSESGNDFAGTVYTLKTDRYGLIKVAEINTGFMFRQKDDLRFFPAVMDHFIEWANSNKASYIRLTPWVPMSKNDQITDLYSVFNDALTGKGFKAIKEGRHTYLIDLKLDEDILLSKMNQPTRKLIQRALKSDMEFKVFEALNDELLETFWTLYHKLAQNKKISSLSQEAFFTQVKGMFERKEALLFVVICSGRIISVVMASKLGTPQPLHGGIDAEYKTMKSCISPGPSSIWSIITTFKNLGYKTYDMGFCPGKIPVESHPHFNIWKFKHNFGPDHMQFMPTYGKVLRPVSGRILQYLIYKK
ncbi:MAG: peptidoglycan bridge formation glycyltransferase FemA/FemB family protein, partial [Bacteroidales bacterium]|nr:peptidoglycan bridge formation glycyltransferase FemA/FemB family protein [Bacteroidales bacterium]